MEDYVSTFPQCADNMQKAEEHFPEMFPVLHILCDSLPPISYSDCRTGTVSATSAECLHHLGKGPNTFVGHPPEKTRVFNLRNLDLCKLKNIS